MAVQAAFTPATTFHGIKEQLDNLPPLGRKPEITDGVKITTINGRHYTTPEQLGQFQKELGSYVKQTYETYGNFLQLTNATFKLLGTHITQTTHTTSDEEQCLQRLKDKTVLYSDKPAEVGEAPDQFEASLTRLSEDVKNLKARINNVYGQLYNDNRAPEIVATDPQYTASWKIKPSCDELEFLLTSLRNRELRKLLDVADVAPKYAQIRVDVANRMKRINQVAKALQNIQANHPVDKTKPVGEQIKEAYTKHKSRQWWKDLGWAIATSPFKLAYNFPTCTAVAAAGLLAYLIPAIPSTLMNSETYTPVLSWSSRFVKNITNIWYNISATP